MSRSGALFAAGGCVESRSGLDVVSDFRPCIDAAPHWDDEIIRNTVLNTLRLRSRRVVVPPPDRH